MKGPTNGGGTATQFSGILSYLSLVAAFAVITFASTTWEYLTTPRTSGWGPPAGLMYVIGSIELVAAGVGLISPPIIMYFAISKSSRLVAAVAYLGVMVVYLALVCAVYSPWVPLRQNMGIRISIGGVIGTFVTVFGFAAFWSLLRPTLARLMLTSLSALLALFVLTELFRNR